MSKIFKKKKGIVLVGVREQVRKACREILLPDAIYPSKQTFVLDHAMLVISYGC